MTMLGKVLVFITVLLSFLMFSWALALYTNRIDWSATPAKGSQPEGMLVGRKKRVEAAYAALNLADARWREVNSPKDGLAAWDKRRIDDRAWYAVELKALTDGPGGNLLAPVSAVQIKDGVPVLDAAGRPALAPAARRKAKPEDPNQPLYCSRYYDEKMADATRQIDAQQTVYQQLIKQESDLTEKAIGPKGLRQQIIDEQAKNARVDEELKDVAGRRTNNLVDVGRLQERRERLERRVEELKKARAGKE
jgi:hypothetical protein